MLPPQAAGKRHNTGQTGEFIVAAELARLGYTVSVLPGNAPDIDLLAYRSGTKLAVQVKSAAGGSHQFNLGKFVEVRFTENGGQTVRGAREDIDRTIIVALVQVGTTRAQDSIQWTNLGCFADFLAKSHAGYLEKHNGRRPGSNPKSLHTAHPHQNFEEICKPLGKVLNTTSE